MHAVAAQLRSSLGERSTDGLSLPVGDRQIGTDLVEQIESLHQLDGLEPVQPHQQPGRLLGVPGRGYLRRSQAVVGCSSHTPNSNADRLRSDNLGNCKWMR